MSIDYSDEDTNTNKSAYAFRLAHQRQVQRSARRQMCELNLYRAQMAEQAQLRAEMESLRARQSAAQCAADAEGASRSNVTAEAPESYIPTDSGPFGDPAYLKLWLEHESSWAAFNAAPPRQITHSSIPWPPGKTSHVIVSIAAAAAASCKGPNWQPGSRVAAGGPQSNRDSQWDGQQDGQWGTQRQGLDSKGKLWDSGRIRGDDEVSERAAFREASLRWHPDKFVQRFGGGLVEADRERTLARVQVIAQELNSAWSERNR